jgi:hypothetical protein
MHLYINLKKEGGFIHAVQDHPQRYFELLAGGPSGIATTALTHTSSHSALRIDGMGITPTSTATVQART